MVVLNLILDFKLISRNKTHNISINLRAFENKTLDNYEMKIIFLLKEKCFDNY